MELALSFDDVLLKPRKTSISSRSEIDLSTNVAGIELKIPIISANMPSVTEQDMAIQLSLEGGLGIIHRMCSINDQSGMVKHAKLYLRDLPVGAAIGIGEDWKDRSKALIKAGVDILCIDVAHGHQERVLNVVKEFREKFSFSFPLVVGNITTPEAAEEIFELSNYENTAVKVGVGGGSMCTTRIITGCGMPTFQSLLDVSGICTPLHFNILSFDSVIADGGIKNSGDIVKSLAAGAGSVMLGSLLAGTDETPGEVIKGQDGIRYKVYRGAASYGEKKQFFDKAEYIEGAETLVPYKGNVAKIIKQLTEGIKSGFSYCGATNILELQEKSKFIRITPAGFHESAPHGLI